MIKAHITQVLLLFPMLLCYCSPRWENKTYKMIMNRRWVIIQQWKSVHATYDIEKYVKVTDEWSYP